MAKKKDFDAKVHLVNNCVDACLRADADRYLSQFENLDADERIRIKKMYLEISHDAIITFVRVFTELDKSKVI